LTGTDSGGLRAAGRPRAHSLDGNGVALDQQLTKVADTETTQTLTATIYKKYMGLFGIALGKGV
jgi:flagellar basal-body rod protein FlgB